MAKQIQNFETNPITLYALRFTSHVSHLTSHLFHNNFIYDGLKSKKSKFHHQSYHAQLHHPSHINSHSSLFRYHDYYFFNHPPRPGQAI